MAKRYANKTCQKCGALAPANTMKQKTISSVAVSGGVTGKGKRGSTRLYARNRKVWRCRDCMTDAGDIIGAFFGWTLLALMGLFFYGMFL